MRELDHCGAIGAALIKLNARKPDPRYKEGIDLATTHILTRQLRLPDGTLARAAADGHRALDRRRLHEHPVPRADGRR